MFRLVGWHMAHLAAFSGRQSRKPFWLWTALVIGLNLAAMVIVMVPVLFNTITRLEDFAARNPDRVTRTVGPGHYSVRVEGYHPELMPDFSAFFAVFGIAALVTILLLAAPVARRLHDTGRTGLWGLIPAGLLLAGLIGMNQLFGQAIFRDEPPLGLFLGLFLTNLAYLVSLGVLIVLLAQPGTAGDNRFGHPPSGEPPT